MFEKLKILAAALAVVAPLAVAGPAHAQARGVAVVSVDGAIQNSNAFRTAATQIQSTYAAQIQQAQTRATALDAELAPLRQAALAAQQANTNPQVTPPAVTTYAQRQQAAEQEINTIRQPVILATMFVREQIGVHFNDALQAAMTASNVDLVISPEAVAAIAPNSPANLTSAVTTQLNSRVPSVQAIPPAGWSPGDTARAAAQQQQPAQQPDPGR